MCYVQVLLNLATIAWGLTDKGLKYIGFGGPDGYFRRLSSLLAAHISACVYQNMSFPRSVGDLGTGLGLGLDLGLGAAKDEAADDDGRVGLVCPWGRFSDRQGHGASFEVALSPIFVNSSAPRTASP